MEQPIPKTEAPAGPLKPPAESLAFSDKLFLAIENPVLRRELLTALRSNKAFILQFVYLFALSVVVYKIWPREVISPGAEVTRSIFRTFGQSQLALIAILAPAFSAAAMTIEKERRCMDLLLTSPMRPGVILIGKYLSAVTYLFLLVLSTAPLVYVLIWLAGLDPMEIAGLYVLLLALAAGLCMLGLTASVFFHRSQSSVALTYMVVLPIGLTLLICAGSFDGFFHIYNTAWLAAFLLAATLLMYRACHVRLRRPFNPVFKAAEEEDLNRQSGLVLVRDRFPDNLLASARNNEPLPDTANPVYQKEIRNEIFGRGTLFLRLIIQISMFMSVFFLTFLYMNKEHIFAYYLVIFTMLAAPAFACNTFTQERERGTLDLLLTTLVRPGQVVWGKFLACLRLSCFLTGLIGITLCFYVCVGKDPFFSRFGFFLVYLALLLAAIFFETALAMFFSLLCKSSVQSMITTYAILLILYGVPVAADQILGVVSKLGREDISYLLFVSPFEAIYSVSSKESAAEAQVALWPQHLALYLGLSLLFMALVYLIFERRCKVAR
jgi:ABC-type transport system involved in multi-copper enzyme maturation permease subunit